MNLFKYLATVFPTENSFFKWVSDAGEEVDELQYGYGNISSGYVAVKAIPEPPKNNNLILPENYEAATEMATTHTWVLDLQKSEITFHLIPTFGHIQLPGYSDVFLVRTTDISLS